MYEEQISKLKQLNDKIFQNRKALNFDALKGDYEKLKKQQSDPELYNDIKKMKELNIKVKQMEVLLEPWKNIKHDVSELSVLAEMASEEEDETLGDEINSGLHDIEKRLERLEILLMFKDEDDKNNCYLTIHSGAGGTESCDWAEMLFRMYCRWAESRGFAYKTVDLQPGDEAGIKSVTIFIEGAYAFGYLKSEIGIHRLVRISPFDSNKRRHTSFVSVYATPEIDESIEVEIDMNDVRVDTYRASGAGGQHVNTTDSAVRLTHEPTGIVVTCQNERSQTQNKETAMKMLRAKIYEKMKADREAEIEGKAADKKKIEWGSQIRSYVFHPYNMVKDHRTNFESGNTQAVMGGGIDEFIYAWLKQ